MLVLIMEENNQKQYFAAYNCQMFFHIDEAGNLNCVVKSFKFLRKGL